MTGRPSEKLSFEQAYQDHFAFVWRSLRRLGVREADSADAAQEVFVVVHRKLAEFEGRAKLTTWLFRICLRVASDYGRRAHVRRELYGESLFDGLLDPGVNAEQQQLAREELRLLERALDSMSLPQRSVFVLFELEGLSCPEIREILDVPLGTVYSRLRTARAAFEQAVAERTREPVAALVTEGP